MLIMNELTCLYYLQRNATLEKVCTVLCCGHGCCSSPGGGSSQSDRVNDELPECLWPGLFVFWLVTLSPPATHKDTQEVPTVSRVLVWWHLLRAKKLLSGQVLCENIYKIQIRCCKFSSETPTELYRAWRVCCCWLLSPTKQDVIQPRMWNRGNSLLQIDQPPCDLFNHKRIISESQMCFLSRRIREKPHWLEFKCWLRRLLEKKDHFLSVFLWGGHGLRTNVVMRSSLLSPGHDACPPEDAVTSVTAVPNSL